MKIAGILSILAVATALLLAGCQLPGDPPGSVFGTISVDAVYANEPIAAWGTNYYRFTPWENGGHTISLYNLDSDMGWTLYSSSDLSAGSEIWDQDGSEGTTSENALVNLAAGVTYYLRVDEWDTVAGYYDLWIAGP